MSTIDVQASAHPGNTVGVSPTLPTRECRSEKCEISIHIGVFFDGTGNNQDWVENASVNWRKGLLNWWNDKSRNTRTQLQQQCDSNVARLFRAYPDEPTEGYFRGYIPGVGTPFKDIGEDEPRGLGAAFGAGGDGRINYGMLHVLNSMYRAISGGVQPLVPAPTVQALCSTGSATMHPKTGLPNLNRGTQNALRAVGMDQQGGLLMDANHGGHRDAFFKAQFATLAARIASTPKPQLVEVFIDVFGFSRGAAQARTFCNWMDDLFQGDRLAGVMTHIRFLGLFDTVAAVGVGASASAFTDGHQSWGDASYLRIPARVRHCEHLVAMHENRSAFPLEDLRMGGALPPRCRQYRFPGMHSDVGGGYAPSDQGCGPGGQDSEKLSQIPLNHMAAAAHAAKVPLNKRLAVDDRGWDSFAIAPALQQAYDAFLQANGSGERALKDCMLDYLAWRIAVRHDYANLPASRRASADDRDDLIGANATLVRDLDTVQGHTSIDARITEQRRAASFLNPRRRELQALDEEKLRRASEMRSLSATAREVVQRAQALPPTPSAVALLFSQYCHDSYAGFKPFDTPVAAGVDMPGTWEIEGYLRYRTRYAGSDARLTRLTMPPTTTEADVMQT